MPRSSLPPILLIDDDDQSANAVRTVLQSVTKPVIRLPNDVSDSDLKRAKLVLIDFRLERWHERDSLPTPSLQPQDGIALAAVLRSNLRRLNASPTAFALISGKLTELSGSRTANNREHAIAKSIDLEWVFAKGVRHKELAQSVTSLANAVARLPKKWPNIERSQSTLSRLLAVPNSRSWRFRALDELNNSYPPHDILAENSKGIAVLRWLLHSILPFPSFLLDSRYLAARLYLSPIDFRSALEKRRFNELEEFEYHGLLSDFDGPRWWRAGIENWIWRQTKGRPFDKCALERLVQTKLSRNLRITQMKKPVVSLDDQFRPSDDLIELSESVQISPDGWPPFADAAWVRLSEAKSDGAIGALVTPPDRVRLD